MVTEKTEAQAAGATAQSSPTRAAAEGVLRDLLDGIMGRSSKGINEESEISQSNFLFSNLKKYADLTYLMGLDAWDRRNRISEARMQNSVDSSEELRTLFRKAVSRTWSDEDRLARELEPMEAVANRLVMELTKMSTQDYLSGIMLLTKYIQDVLETQQAATTK